MGSCATGGQYSRSKSTVSRQKYSFSGKSTGSRQKYSFSAKSIVFQTKVQFPGKRYHVFYKGAVNLIKVQTWGSRHLMAKKKVCVARD